MLRRSSFVILAAAVALAVAVIVVLSSPQVRAGPPPPVTILDSASVRAAGRTIELPTRTVNGVRLVDPVGPAGPTALIPLAAAPDGRALVVSRVGRGQVGPLTIALADGSQLDVALPGVRGAAFDPSGEWLAAVDLAGGLWRVEAQTGAAWRVADGPFGSAPTVLSDGRVLAVRLSSVDAPVWSAAVIVDVRSGVETPLAASPNTQDQLVYQATALSDGSVALVRHRTGGGVTVLRVTLDGVETPLMDLDVPLAAVSPDGQWVAWAAATGRVMIAGPGTQNDVRDLGTGTGARFSPDSSLLIIFTADGTRVVDLNGNVLVQAGPAVCWLGDGRGCRP